MSHSWHTHNYSISSTINGNALKLHAEIKQTPSLCSSSLLASTLLPITPSIPSPPSPYTLSSLSNTLFNHLFILPSQSRAHICIRCTWPLLLPPKREHVCAVSRAARSVCVCIFVSVRSRDRKQTGGLCYVSWTVSVQAL